MRQKIDKRIPRYTKLISPTFQALKKLGGSGKNDETVEQIIEDLCIPDAVADIPHLNNPNKSELSYLSTISLKFLY